MPLRRIDWLPESSGYGFSFPEDTRQTPITVPKSTFATNNAENARTLELTWVLTGTEYAEWYLFWEDHNYGNLPFLMDLILDDFLLSTYTCKFVPGTWQLNKVQGQLYTVKCSVNVVKYNAFSA